MGLSGGWGGGLGWGWGNVLDFRVGPHQLYALSLGGGFWVSVALEHVSGIPAAQPQACSSFFAPFGAAGSSLEEGAERREEGLVGVGEDQSPNLWLVHHSGL